MKRLITAMTLTFAVSMSTLSFAGKSETAANPEEAPEVSLEEFKTLADKKTATIIDANGAQMYADGHVPGAISFASAQGKLGQFLPKDKTSLIVAYCGGPMCTAWQFAAKEAQNLGYTNIKHYKGGIKGWKEAGLPVVSMGKKPS